MTLASGFGALFVAGYILLGGSWNLQWVLAIGAVVIGIVMLVASLCTPYRD